MKRHVALVGFMAAGKSTVGKRLARRLKRAFFDVDDLVVREHGAVSDIFYNEGEAAFRRYEQRRARARHRRGRTRRRRARRRRADRATKIRSC